MRIAAVVPAAGFSSRAAPVHKLLAPLAGRAVIARTVAMLREAGLDEIVLVVGHRGDEVAAAAASGGPVSVVRIADPARGLGASLAAGIAVLPDAVAGALVALGDMPLVLPATIRALVARFESETDPRAIVRPRRDGLALNPVLWGRAHFAALSSLADRGGDRGGSAIASREAPSVRLVDTADPGVALDLDDPAAFAAADALLRGRGAI